MTFSQATRQASLTKLANTTQDLLIIGGGITGAASRFKRRLAVSPPP